MVPFGRQSGDQSAKGQMILSWQLDRGWGAFVRADRGNEVTRTDRNGQVEQLAVTKAASTSNRCILSGDEMMKACESVSVELRFVATDGLNLRFKRFCDVHDERARPMAVLCIERKGSVDQMSHTVGRQALEAIVPFCEL
jgi:hypothetical protein